MKSHAPSVLVSIVTWNHAHCIAACLQSVLAQTLPVSQIIVYDNASSDDTRSVLATFKDRVQIIFSPENRGFCGGHNAVLASTQCDFVLLVNPDIVLREDYLARAVAAMQADTAIGTVCGRLVQSKSDHGDALLDGTGLTMSRSRRLLLRDHGKPMSLAHRSLGEVFGADGALPLYRRAMIDSVSVGGQFFDEMFFAHKEDHDVSWRSRLCGWKTIFVPDCVALHPRVFRPGDLQLRKQLAPEIKYHAVKNDLLMLLKNEDASNFIKDFLHIFPRRLGIFFYALLREQSSLKAYSFVFKNRRAIRAQRREIMRLRKLSPARIRACFSLGEMT